MVRTFLETTIKTISEQFVRILVLRQELIHQHGKVRARICNRRNRRILNLQLLPLSRTLPVVQRRVFPQPQGELMAVVNQHRTVSHQPLIELRQRVQQVWPLLRIPENPGLVLIRPMILSKRLRVSWPQLVLSGSRTGGLYHGSPESKGNEQLVYRMYCR